MASFTDSISQFNPYIPQLPVDAMVKVGMQKQAQYDQGVQKIQGYIDNIAGMDVVRDVDKQYLQSKLNELGGRLRTVAAGDFSNAQLVNSVGGMATQIVKDSDVQNAVYSTQMYRRGLEDKRAAQKAGKGAPSNDWLFDKQASEWLSSKELKKSFNSGYEQYTNWKKNSLESIKALTGDSTITEDAFTVDRDAKGNPIIGADGKPKMVLADAMIRTKLAGISPEKIQQALVSTLSPADMRQMQIDSLYDYSNQDAEKFKNTVVNTFTDRAKGYADQVTILENAKMSTTSAIEKSKLDEKITALNKTIANVDKEKNGLLESINGGQLDSAKANFGVTNAIGGIARTFSHLETSQTYENSPLLQAQQFRETKEQDWKKFTMNYAQEEKWKSLGYNLDLQKIGISKEANDLKRKELEGYGGLPGDIDQSLLPKYNLGRVVADIETGKKEIETAKTTFLKQQGKDEGWLLQQQTAWEKNPSGVDPLVSDYFNSIANKQRQIDSDKIMLGDINKQATKEFGDINNLIPKGSPNLIYKAGNEVYDYSPKDFVDVNQMRGAYQSSYGGAGGSSAVTYDKVKAKEELSPKQYHLWEVANGLAPKNNANKILYDNLANYNIKVNTPFKTTLAEINNYTAAEVTKRLTTNQGLEYAIPTGTTAQKTSIASMLSSFANLAETQKGGLANSPDFDVKKAREIAVDSEAKYNIKVIEATSIQPAMYQITATGNKGNIVQFNVTPEQKRSIFGNQFEASPAVQMIRPYQEQIRKMGGYSTAIAPGSSNHNNAFLNKIDFPSMQNYGIKANIVEPSPGKYSIRLSLFDPTTQKWHEDISFPRGQLITEDNIAGALIGLNDAVAYELVNEKPATANDLKRLQQATKKPL
jgi:hypothetical protein